MLETPQKRLILGNPVPHKPLRNPSFHIIFQLILHILVHSSISDLQGLRGTVGPRGLEGLGVLGFRVQCLGFRVKELGARV